MTRIAYNASRRTATWDGTTIYGVHDPASCRGRVCVIHNPTDHHMRGWTMHWRDDRSIFERICPHGIGHPDPDQRDHWRRTDQSWQAVHGCDGCCQLADLGDAE